MLESCGVMAATTGKGGGRGGLREGEDEVWREC